MLAQRNIVDNPEPKDHVVQLYCDESVLVRTVGRYLYEGFHRGDSALVIATEDHSSAFRADLEVRGVDVARLMGDNQFLVLGAERTLSSFMVQGRPDWERFETTIANAAAAVHIRPGHKIRAYGEMVGLLWTDGQYSAAISLENHWNRMLDRLQAALFCAYPIDVFGREFQKSSIHAILCDHNHLVPAEQAAELRDALNSGVHKVLGVRAAEALTAMHNDCSCEAGIVPEPERMILWVRERLPNSAEQILITAREVYTAACLGR